MNHRRVALLATAAVFGLSLAAQTTITQVSNAASYGSDIAQGSIFVVFGTNMGPAALAQAPSLPLATTLSGTSIKFTPASGGAAVDAFMVYTSARQLAGLLPSTAAAGNYNVTVTYNGTTSANFPARVVQRAYGMITVNSAGNGLAVIQNASEGSAINLFSAPARPGQTMVLWGTGLGPVSVPDNNRPGVQDLRSQAEIRVVVGDTEITPVYAGRSPDLPGADQINFVLPANVATGCTVNLQVRVGSTLSAPANIAIAPTGRAVCQHPFLSDDSLRRIESGGTVTLGSFALISSAISFSIPGLPIPPVDQTTETVGGAFQKLTFGNVDQVTDQFAPNIGSCYVIKGTTDSSGQVATGSLVTLDAGRLTINGPGVSNREIPKIANENYYSLGLSVPSVTNPNPAKVIAAGTYTITGAGGADVGPFTASVNVASPITWTNRTTINSINRAVPLVINWTGGTSADQVIISGTGGKQAAGTSADNPKFESTTFVCIARGDARTFSVPVSILQQLPAVDFGISAGGGGVPSIDGIGILTVQAGNGTLDNGRFTAPLTAGGNIDIGSFYYAVGGAALVSIR